VHEVVQEAVDGVLSLVQLFLKGTFPWNGGLGRTPACY
jgi:hypothetical protein